MCLALVAFHEAGNQSMKGKMATIEVVQNRVNSSQYKDGHCAVVKQPSQFSWVNSSNRALNKVPQKVNLSAGYKKQWEDSKKAARTFIASPTNYTKGAKYFNTLKLGVRYKTKVSPVTIGNHIFY
jgi:spore germination cell wall hydrolase CwlJ-like protein